MDQVNIYNLPLMGFDDWADHVERHWRRMLNQKLGFDGTRVAMRIHRSMLAECANAAYEEYCSAWDRRHRFDRQEEREGNTV